MKTALKITVKLCNHLETNQQLFNKSLGKWIDAEKEYVLYVGYDQR